MRVLALTVLLMSTPVIVYGWPWEIGINKLSVLQITMEIPEHLKPNPAAELSATERLVGGRINSLSPRTDLKMRLKNNTDAYVKSVIADCVIYDKDKNRLFKGERPFYSSAEVAPGGTGTFESTWERGINGSESIQCQLTSAKGAK